MWNLKQGTSELIYKTEINRVTDVEDKLMVPWGERGGGINWEIEMDIHALLYVKWASQVMLVVKNPPANKGHTRDAGWIPGLR